MVRPPSPLRSPLRVALAYVCFGVVWILSSDRIALLLFPDPAVFAEVQTYKGIAFVLISAAVVFTAVRFELRSRRRAELALEANQQKLEGILEGTMEAVAMIDRDGLITYANPAGYALLRHSGDASEPMHSRALAGRLRTVEGGPVALEDTPSARALKGESARNVRRRLLMDDGSERIIVTSAVPVRDTAGQIVSALTTTRDVTDVYETERELHRRDAYLRVLIESVSDIIAVLDKSGRLRFHTPSTQQILGYSESEIDDRNIFELIHPDDREPIRDAVERTLRLEGELGQPVSLRVRHKDGSWRELEAIGTRLIEPDRDEQILLTARDVTERRRAEEALAQSEEQLRHAQKMEAVGRLAGGVAHDFNNLITSVLGYAQLLQESLEHPTQLADLREIQQAGERAHALTRQLLTLSRRDMRRPEPVDVGALVKTDQRLLERLMGETVRVVIDVAPTPRVLIDPGQLEQVLLNLAVNARDAMPEGGYLRLAVFAEDRDSGARVVLEVADTGVGMDPEIQARIFEPFFTTKDPDQGTGLGLSLVYGVVTRAGGQIDVSSAPERGTTFRIDLPALLASSADEDTDTSGGLDAIGSGRGLTVLVVEDEMSVRKLCHRLLTRLGYGVLLARHGEEALAAVAQHPDAIDLVLTDVVMPVMGGDRLVEALAERCPNLPVVVMSGYTPDVGVRNRLERGHHPFLAKPFSPRELARLIRDTLEKSQVISNR